MKDRRRTALRLIALFLIGCIGVIRNESAPRFFSTSLNEYYSNYEERRLESPDNGAKRVGSGNVGRGNIAAGNDLLANTNVTVPLTELPDYMKQDHVVISEKKLTYRYSQSFSQATTSSHSNMDLVVGVLSHANGYGLRQGIRETWAENYKGRIFFLVAGKWSSRIESEFQQHEDLIWIDIEEKFWHLTYKVQMFFHAVEKHYGLPYKYIMKTDDDSYVALTALNLLLKKRKKENIDLFGKCTIKGASPKRDENHRYYVPKEVYPHSTYPIYAQGRGYMVSKSINKCMITKMASLNYMPMEDVATGLLIRECHSTCTNLDSISKYIPHHLRDNVSKKKINTKWKMMPYMSERAQLRIIDSSWKEKRQQKP